MRIAIDARMYGTEYTGVGRYIKNLIDNLQKIDRQNNYTVLLRKKYFETLRLASNFEKVLADFDHYGFKEQILLPKILNQISPHLVHFPHFNVPLLYRGKFVVTIHDAIMSKQKGKDATTRNRYFSKVKRFGYNTAFNYALKNSEAIIVPSKFSKDELSKNLKVDSQKIKVIYEAVDENVKPIRSKTGEYKNSFGKFLETKYFIYSGNAYPHKNVNRLVEAIKYLNDEINKPVKLVIVTPKNTFREKLTNFAKSIGATKYLEFTRFLSDDELGFLYSKAHAFVYPSTEEGFGLPGLEAISNKTLLLASDIKVFREVYKNAAIYFNPYDFSSIQKAMFDSLNLAKELRAKKITESQKVLDNYSLEKMAKETLKIYESSNRLR